MSMFKKVALAGSLLVASNVASAADYVWDFSMPFQNIFTSGTVDDKFTFELDGPVSLEAVTVAWGLGNGVTLSLYSYDGALLGTGTGDVISFVSADYLMPGAYATATGYVTNGYSFAAEAVTAVPEPATYGLMLGGLGLVGFMAARRRKA